MGFMKTKKAFQIFFAGSIVSLLVVYFTFDLRLSVIDPFIGSPDPTPTTWLHLTSSNQTAPSSTDFIIGDGHFKLRPRGNYIRVGDLDVALVTAVHYRDYPAKGGFNVFLNGWAKYQSPVNFKCCFLNNQNATDVELVETMASMYHMYSQWKVDMQNAEFSCSLSQKQIQSFKLNNTFQYVAFAQNTCLNASKNVLKIEYTKKVPNSVGICLKISYGYLDPELVVEWFEYQKLVGVTKVYSFLAESLDPNTRKVFEYYDSTGFSETDPIHPAYSKSGTKRGFWKPWWDNQARVEENVARWLFSSNCPSAIRGTAIYSTLLVLISPDGTKRGFKKPRWEHQAWVDEVMAINDCKHRMSGFDFVIVHDIDEFIVPTLKGDTIHSVLQKTLKKYPKTGAFSLDSHVSAFDWGPTRASPLNVMRYTNISKTFNWDGADRNTRWAFIPDRIVFAQNNKAWPRTHYSAVRVNNGLFKLIHQRLCKKSWSCCQNDTSLRQPYPILARYEEQLVLNVQKLPLPKILSSNSTQYIKDIMSWKRTTQAV